jgi:hypothetical protein
MPRQTTVSESGNAANCQHEKSHVQGVAPGSKQRRKPRSKALPEPPSGVETPYANCREEWKGVGLGEKVKVILDSGAWQEVMIPALLELEAERPRKGPRPAYTSEELERAVLFQKLAGVATYGKARLLLASDREGETRELLGFNRPRRRVGSALRLVKSLDGVPSEVTIWKHLQRWGLERHIAAYQQLFQQLVGEHLAVPEFRQEARALNIDGSVIRSHYTSKERLDRKTGELKPATLDGGGFMPRRRDNQGKDGHGFNMVAVSTSTGLPLAYRLTPLATKGHGEADTALAMFRDEWKENVVPHLDPEIAVLTGDAAYTKQALRAELRTLGILENCHRVSHGSSATNKRNERRTRAREYQIEDYPNWRANGHREIHCLCGGYKLAKRVSRNQNGEVVSRVEGECKTCGTITITSGRWRAAQNPRRFVRCQPGEEHEADWLFGNPLTFNDKLSAQFGRNRFGHGEGFHGHLQTRFGLLKNKAWYRRREQAQLDFLMVFCGMHALAMEQRRRAARGAGGGSSGPAGLGGQQAQAPPGLAAAA